MSPRFKHSRVHYSRFKPARFMPMRFKPSRSLSRRPLLGEAYRLVRQPSKITLWVAAGTVVVAAAVAVGLSAGPSTPSGAANDLAGAQRAAATHQPGSAGTASPGRGQQANANHQSGSGQTQGRAHASHASAPTSRHAPARQAPAKNYTMYDSVLPSALPANQTVATYATGPFAVSQSAVRGHKAVLWIDTIGNDYNASILDVEPGDATPAIAGQWVLHRLRAHPHAIARLYTMISEWSAVQAAVAQLPARMRSQVRYWIADPTGTPHLVPGSDATQWYWGSSYDMSTVTPRF